eukprot:TRINITY_DN28764_c0_g1_i1.p1 TRINITY_DN28764_c0_g1~~TRINITY_DN28764_c0_g1_i1.p1  ORF type:complete len:505 (+),score=97.23 TRINITY_DN28764_c0_g1_i1:65-1579(+)
MKGGKSRSEQCMAADLEVGKRRRHASTVSLRVRNRSEVVNVKRMQPLEPNDSFTSPLLQLRDEELFQRFHQIVEALAQGSRSERLLALKCLRKLLLSDVIPNDTIVNRDICVLVVSSAQTDDACVNGEAAACLGILTESDAHAQYIAEVGCIQALVPLLTRSPGEAEQALWTLASLGAKCVKSREVLLACDVLKPLCDIISLQPPQAVLKNAVWLLSSLTTIPQFSSSVVEHILPILASLLHETDEDILVDSCWCLANLTDYGSAEISLISSYADHMIIKRLADLLASALVPTIVPLLRVFGNMASGPTADVDYIISLDVLPMMCYLLAHQKKATRKEVCWALSNIMAGSRHHIQMCFEANLVPPLVASLQVYEVEVKKEAAWALCNCAKYGTPEQINYLVMHGVVVPLLELLRSPDKELLLVVLEGLRYILEANMVTGYQMEGLHQVPSLIQSHGGIEFLEALLEHQTDLIHEAAGSIIDTIEKGVEEEGGCAVDVSPGCFRF